MLTGQYAHTHGKMAHVKMPLVPRPPLLPELLARQGYRTGYVGKTHWWPPDDALGCEDALLTIDNHLTPELGDSDAYIQFLRQEGVFDYIADTWQRDRGGLQPDSLPPECLKVNWTADTACDLLSRYARDDQPFFLACSFVEPHGAGSVQTRYLESLGEMSLPPVVGREDERVNKPETQRRAVAAWEERIPDAQRERRRRGVYASLHLVDRGIGRILSALDASRAGDNTLVMFLTDHGDLLFDHGCTEKTFLYDAAVRIPFLVRGPGIPSDGRRSHLVSQVDLLPTVLDYCGIREEDLRIEGRSLRPVVQAPEARWRESLFCEVEQTVHLMGLVESSAAKMVRRGPWKYIYTLVDGHRVEEELYNLEDDPDELRSLSDEPSQRERKETLKAEILRWLVATEVNRLSPVPESHYPTPRVGKAYL